MAKTPCRGRSVVFPGRNPRVMATGKRMVAALIFSVSHRSSYVVVMSCFTTVKHSFSSFSDPKVSSLINHRYRV